MCIHIWLTHIILVLHEKTTSIAVEVNVFYLPYLASSAFLLLRGFHFRIFISCPFYIRQGLKSPSKDILVSCCTTLLLYNLMGMLEPIELHKAHIKKRESQSDNTVRYQHMYISVFPCFLLTPFPRFGMSNIKPCQNPHAESC